jgi:hypothetical protein
VQVDLRRRRSVVVRIHPRLGGRVEARGAQRGLVGLLRAGLRLLLRLDAVQASAPGIVER